VDPGAVWGGELGRSSDGCIRSGWSSSKGLCHCFVINVEHSVVTNVDFLA